MRLKRVVCTGLGLVTPLGVGTKQSWRVLLASKSGIVKLKDEHSFCGGQSKVAAYVPDKEMDEKLGDPKHAYISRNAKQLSRASSFAMLAAHEALEDSKLLDDTGLLHIEFRERCGVAIGQGMVDFEDIFTHGNLIHNTNDVKSGFRKVSPYFMTRALINMSAGNISIRYKMHGPNHCASTACATGAHSIGDSMNFIRLGLADLMVCGSTEASINSIAMAGFERLRALSTRFNDEPAAASRPFDKDRCGFVMGEGAGILVLESYEHALKRGLTSEDIYCEILGYGTSSDAHHLTAPSPNGLGAKLSMKNALANAGLNASMVRHVNAHATSTPLGDDIECNAIEEIFEGSATDKEKITVTSCKSSIGHLLGGAGSVESIFGILSCKEGLLIPCLNCKNPISTPKNSIEFLKNSKPWEKDRRIFLKNSFGFGGTNATLVISNLI